MPKNDKVSRIGVWSLLYSQNQDMDMRFSIGVRSYGAYHVYEISETFNGWMQRYEQKHQKYPQNGGFPCHFCTLMVPKLNAKN